MDLYKNRSKCIPVVRPYISSHNLIPHSWCTSCGYRKRRCLLS